MNLWTVGSDGSGLRQLTSGNSDFLPLFAPDGQSVFYGHAGDGFPYLHRVELSGGSSEKISDLKATPLDVSPDGQSLIVRFFDESANRWRPGIFSSRPVQLRARSRCRKQPVRSRGCRRVTLSPTWTTATV